MIVEVRRGVNGYKEVKNVFTVFKGKKIVIIKLGGSVSGFRMYLLFVFLCLKIGRV